jgi:hypothetical protein
MGAKHRSRDTRTTSKPAGGLHPDGEKFIVDRYRTGMKNDMLCWRSFRACLVGLRLLQKQLRLWLLWWSGFSGGVESF